MYTDPVLAEKERVQKELSRQANYNVRKLFENMHKKVVLMAKESDTVLKYSNRKGGYINITNEESI